MKTLYKNALLALLPAVCPVLHGQAAANASSAMKVRGLGTYASNISAAATAVQGAPYTPRSPMCNGGDITTGDLAYNIVALRCNELAFVRLLAARPSYYSFLQTAEGTVSKQQLGASSSSSGTTDLVTKAAVAQVLGIAVNGGALTQSTSGSTTTFTANALSLSRYLTGHEVFPFCPNPKGCDTFLDKAAEGLTGSLSLDNTTSSAGTTNTQGTTANPSAQTPATPLSGSGWRMSSWGLQYAVPFLNTNTSRFRKAWDKSVNSANSNILTGAASKMNTALAGALDKLETSSDYAVWEQGTSTEKGAQSKIADLLKQKATPATIEQELRADLEELIGIAFEKGYLSNDQITSAVAATNAFFATRNQVITTVKSTLPELSFAYSNNHPLNEANVSNFKAIFQIQPTSWLSVTANGAADMYDSSFGSAIARWRDVQFSAELDFTLPSKYDNAVFSVAGYYQDQRTKAVLQIPAGNTAPNTGIVLAGPAATLLAPTGDIQIYQAMVTFPLKNSTKIPIGVSWANRTDLLPGSIVRAHLGINFSFANLFMKGGTSQ